MPGMNSGLSPSDPMLVAAFRSALLHQGAIALLMLVFLWLLWAAARTWRPAASPATARASAGSPAVAPPVPGDAAGRQVRAAAQSSQRNTSMRRAMAP